MNKIYSVSEVKLSYEPKVKASERAKVQSSFDIYQLLINSIFDPKTIEHKEYFKIILLNTANRVIGVHLISQGGINQTVIDIRIIMQAAILSNATQIILAHNHPSGALKPSSADNATTQKIKQACEIMSITLLDHLIITNEGYYSYADECEL